MDPKNEKLLMMKKAAEEKKQHVQGIRPLLDAAQAHLTQGKLAEARQVSQGVLEKEPV